ncbi:OLC1v1018474C2 [Oldenlandia corymbosa var. corymbosa]|uniref:Signal recognition particle 14 kDa protein n=1 Tax=Oldenlandia corymbosa var. corymbosa TaxID=529605 RepID=A0AAV1EBU2_OLDCO|nr:OLC1v1018474C2 [Oldenlandia corymbosa var. corymbosa]
MPFRMSTGTGQLPHTSTSKARLQPDPFLNELSNMFEQNTEKGSVWVTLKHSSDMCKAHRNKMTTPIEFKCLIRATDGKRTISTLVSPTFFFFFEI